jgi:hypothetical protein
MENEDKTMVGEYAVYYELGNKKIMKFAERKINSYLYFYPSSSSDPKILLKDEIIYTYFFDLFNDDKIRIFLSYEGYHFYIKFILYNEYTYKTIETINVKYYFDSIQRFDTFPLATFGYSIDLPFNDSSFFYNKHDETNFEEEKSLEYSIIGVGDSFEIDQKSLLLVNKIEISYKIDGQIQTLMIDSNEDIALIRILGGLIVIGGLK